MSVKIVSRNDYRNDCSLNAFIDKQNSLIIFSDGTKEEYKKSRYYNVVFAKVFAEKTDSVAVDCAYFFGQSLLTIQDILLSNEQDVEVTVIAEKSREEYKAAFLDTLFDDKKENVKPNYTFFQSVDVERKQKANNKETSYQGNELILDNSTAFADEDAIDDVFKGLGVSFTDAVFAIIDENHWSDSEVYKRSNISKAVFSNLRKKDYKPSKNTALALCVGLQLDVEASNELLEKAGFVLSNSDKTDVIVKECLRRGIYNIMTINCYLYAYGQNLLGVK